jgi:phenylpyruvate tautomerase PptA (4-oxalocrotonate tautomerase family)
MPLYRVLNRPGLLDPAEREQFSRDVVEVHCGVTGAPASFVHVVYADDVEGNLPVGTEAMVAGTIRAGRNADQKAEIIERLTHRLAEHARIDPATVTVLSNDIESSFTMEGGKLLPEPGSPEEEEWKSTGTAGG